MAATEPVEWRRRFPARALRHLGWFVAGGAGAAVVVWMLFGVEPDRLRTGEINPLALVPTVTTVLLAAAALPFLLALVRRPVVRADHYALTVRPGTLRMLVLPWAHVAEIAGVPVRGEPLLLVRLSGRRGRLGDRPRWCDQGVLRAAIRGAGRGDRAIAAFDLGVRMEEFTGTPEAQLTSLAAWAPDRVLVTDRLS